MPVSRDPPTPGEIEKWFLDVAPAPEQTFEFALVLGGTVSAGAYTAGAVDFLIEAMDCFAKAQGTEDAPPHKAVLKFIAGTSGGGVNAAIAARALAFDYPHIVRSTQLTSQPSGNPFYDVWVNTLRLDGFLKTEDVKSSLTSLLNGKPIDDGAALIVAYGNDKQPIARPWVGDPLRVILTVTNLCGVPYETSLGGSNSQVYVDHADYAKFAFVYPKRTLTEPRPDEQVLSFLNERLPSGISWDDFSEFARATAAFPLGFPARALERPTQHYRWRVVPYPAGPGGASTYLVRTPSWKRMIPDGGNEVPEEWHFLSVDGGATDNEPIELARTSLVGLLNRNPREGDAANRAVWLIDPFAGRAALGPSGNATFVSELGAIVTTLTQQTRYDTADILMAADPNIFSRFMLSPTRGSVSGEDAIASGGLGAFIGFACQDFMRFDYFLGRANCQQFLCTQFLLKEDNPVFAGWSPEQRARFASPTNPGMLPIIPLCGDAAIDEVLEVWPKGKLKPEVYRTAIEARFRAILELELSGSIGKNILGWVGAHATQKDLADHVIAAMNAYLTKANLI